MEETPSLPTNTFLTMVLNLKVTILILLEPPVKKEPANTTLLKLLLKTPAKPKFLLLTTPKPSDKLLPNNP